MERKEIERKMMDGGLAGLVSTNALELGIDIGQLDVTVIVGYPGTRVFLRRPDVQEEAGEMCELSDSGKSAL